jgi:hypothetical protein
MVELPPPGAGKLIYCILTFLFTCINHKRFTLSVLLVYPTSSIPGIDGKSHYFGFSLLLQMDPRSMQDNLEVDYYTARVFTSDLILIKKPAWPFLPLREREQYATHFNASTVAAMDNAIHNSAANKQQRKFKYIILLVFKNKGKK